MSLGAFVKAPPFAWSGWRLRIPGGPEGGQYHGFIGPDSLGWRGVPGNHAPPADPPAPWDSVWGGVALAEGEDRSDYVMRTSAEMRPRSNASGGANVVQAFQTRKSAGYAEAPGNYRGVGALPNIVACPMFVCEHPTSYGPAPCYTPVCGATNMVSQPPPPKSTGPGNVTAHITPPISPAPSPTVSATPTAAISTAGWFSESTIVPGVENMWVAGAAALAAFLLLKGKL